MRGLFIAPYTRTEKAPKEAKSEDNDYGMIIHFPEVNTGISLTPLAIISCASYGKFLSGLLDKFF
jgi:hypothetical protein